MRTTDMGLLSVLDVSLTVVGKRLFNGITLQLESGDRVGLVGPNGSGKTTLLRILIGETTPDGGQVSIADGTRIGYLPQDVYELLSGTLLQSIVDSIPGRVDLRHEIARIEQALEKNPQNGKQETLARRLGQIHQEMADLDRQFPAYGAEKILLGLGFKAGDFKRPLSAFSGGWKMRAALGSLLYQNPDLLLLDEPTNHLDIPSVHWLEQFLDAYRGALILVCHDRDFLNRQIRRVISLEPEGMRSYRGNYDFYLKAREEERKALEARARNREQKIKEAKKFIERFRAKASKARQAQSKIKLIKKMELVKSHQTEKTLHFSIPEVPRAGKVVVEIKGVSKAYGQVALYSDLDLTVFRGERIALIGPNGSGKTTLLRMVAGELDPDKGKILLGHGVTMSYHAQHHSEMLDPWKTIIEEVYQVIPHEAITTVRGVCGAFLFTGEDVDKTIGVLSGGERARVCLAKVLVRPGNLLVMDEPTNHLDIISSEIFIEALADYQGTLLFVSHNQSFINRLATKIWDIREGEILEYPGTLDEYYDHLSRSEDTLLGNTKHPVEPSRDEGQKAPRRSRQSRKALRRERAQTRRFISDILKPIKEDLLRLEEEISGLERKEKELQKTLAEPHIIRDKGKYLPLLEEYARLKEGVEKLLQRWERRQEELASAKEDLEI